MVSSGRTDSTALEARCSGRVKDALSCPSHSPVPLPSFLRELNPYFVSHWARSPTGKEEFLIAYNKPA
jgi:hypothetical protein